jgi:hypothetical protein
VLLCLVYVVKALGWHHVVVGRKILGVAVFGGVALIAGWILLWRAVRAGVVANASGVTIRNIWRSRFLRWSEIARFSVASYGGRTAGCVQLRDGTSVRVWGIQGQNTALFPNSRWAERPIERLNELLHDAQARDNAPQPAAPG